MFEALEVMCEMHSTEEDDQIQIDGVHLARSGVLENQVREMMSYNVRLMASEWAIIRADESLTKAFLTPYHLMPLSHQFNRKQQPLFRTPLPRHGMKCSEVPCRVPSTFLNRNVYP